MARWAEIDLAATTWTVPVGVEHRVPLSDRCVEVLEMARSMAPKSEWVFPSRKARGRPLSNMALPMMLRRLGRTETVHGFRSSFCDWATETTTFSYEVREAALAHQVENETERAYRRGDLFAQRRELMAAWAGFLAGSTIFPDQSKAAHRSTPPT